MFIAMEQREIEINNHLREVLRLLSMERNQNTQQLVDEVAHKITFANGMIAQLYGAIAYVSSNTPE